MPGPLDASILSDEAAAPGTPNFTGAFVGVCCQDLAGTGRPADFDWFDYVEREYLVAQIARLAEHVTHLLEETVPGAKNECGKPSASRHDTGNAPISSRHRPATYRPAAGRGEQAHL